MALILTLVHTFFWFIGVWFMVLFAWGTKANVLLIGLPILYIGLVIFSIIKKDIILNHLIIANVAMIVVFCLVIVLGSGNHRL